MFNLIAYPLGWVMWLIYQLVHSYGMSIILFTFVFKLLTLPGTYKTQVNSSRMGLVAPRVAKLKKSYANNQTKLQEETNRLYQEEGINPSSGCLMNVVTCLLLLGVYQVVMRPITYILRLKDEVAEATTLLSTWLTEHEIAEKFLNTRPELIILKYAKTNPEIFDGISGFCDKVRGFENTFLGFDLGGQPSLSPEEGWTFTTFLLALIPVLSGVFQLILTFVTQRHNKKNNPMMQGMGAMNVMLYAMPMISIGVGFKVPAGLGFYWVVNSALSLFMTLAIYRYLTPARMKVINEKEKTKQLAKGPSWMQKMMDASAQYAQDPNQPNGRVGNRTQSSDGDDGMSRKERAEYDRKLIEAARQRAALKYGETVSSDDAEHTDED